MRNRLEDCPWQGDMCDLLEWAVPVAPRDEDQGHDDRPQGATQQGAGQRADGEAQEPRRSSRAGRGQTSKYDDYDVNDIHFGASATYAQVVSGLGGRGRSW